MFAGREFIQAREHESAEDAWNGLGYVLAVRKSRRVKSLAGIWRIDQLIADAPDGAWQRLSSGDGIKGPRVFGRVAAQLPVIDFFDDEPTHRRWVLARRSTKRPDEIACYLTYCPTGITVAELVRLAGSHWGDWGVLPDCEERVRPG